MTKEIVRSIDGSLDELEREYFRQEIARKKAGEDAWLRQIVGPMNETDKKWLEEEYRRTFNLPRTN